MMLRKLERTGGKPFSLRIPVELHERMNMLKERAALYDLEFSVNGDIINFIEKICDETERELESAKHATSTTSRK